MEKEFRKFPARFDTKCQECGKEVKAGTPIWGRPTDTRKWEVHCAECHGSKEGGSTLKESFDMMDELLGKEGGLDLSDLATTEAKKAPPPPKELHKLIEESAPWSM